MATADCNDPKRRWEHLDPDELMRHLKSKLDLLLISLESTEFGLGEEREGACILVGECQEKLALIEHRSKGDISC